MYPQTVALIVVSTILPVVATFAVLLRVRARALKKNGTSLLDSSDYLIFASLTLAWAISISAICGAVIDHIGSPLLELTLSDFEGFLKVVFASQFFYIFCVGFVKLSIIRFYRTVFITKGFRLACDIIFGIVIAWLISLFFGTLLRSHPISANWDPFQPDSYAGNIVVLFSFTGASDVVLDIVILCLPLPVISGLHMSSRRRWVVAGLFLLGGFCIVAAIVRLVYIIQFVGGYVGTSSYYSTLVVNNLIWLIIEPCASIIAACLPIFGPFIRNGRFSILAPRSLHSKVSASSQPSASDSSGSRQVTQGSRPPSGVFRTPSRVRSLPLDKYTMNISVLDESAEQEMEIQVTPPESARIVENHDAV